MIAEVNKLAHCSEKFITFLVYKIRKANSALFCKPVRCSALFFAPLLLPQLQKDTAAAPVYLGSFVQLFMQAPIASKKYFLYFYF